MENFRENIWKGSRVMALDAAGMDGGVVFLWQPSVVYLKEWWANKFSLMADFQLLETGVNGSLMNVYRPSAFHQK